MAKLAGKWMVIATALMLATASGSRVAVAQSASSGLKQGWDKVTRFFNPSSTPEPANDATSLSSQARPGPDLYVATARMHEQQGNLELAEKQYKQGLRLTPTHLPLQLGYARLKDRQGRLDEAIKLYQEAAKAHPEEAAIFNDMGLCLARRGRLPEAVTSLETATRLQPQRKLYRNNLATVLADMGQIDAALVQLKAVHNDAAACYNLGYLLQKKGDTQLAAVYFGRALQHDPSLTPARIWLDRLAGSATPGPQSSLPAGPPQPLRLTHPSLGGTPYAPANPDAQLGSRYAPGGAGLTPQMSARGRTPDTPRPLPPVDSSPGATGAQSASRPAGIGYRASQDRRRPVALPPVDEAPPSAGQATPDVSVPVPHGSGPGPSPVAGAGAGAGSSSRVAQRPLDPAPSRVRPLPAVEDAPAPPSGNPNDPGNR